MEQQDKLSLGVGTEEFKQERLSPAKVKVLNVSIETKKVKGKDAEIVILSVKHHEREEPLAISKAKFDKGNQLRVIGLWMNFDDKGQIQKGTSVADFLVYAQVSSLKELIGKELDAIQDEKGYLVLRAYN